MKYFLLPIGWMLGSFVTLSFRYNTLWFSIVGSMALLGLQIYVCVFDKSKE